MKRQVGFQVSAHQHYAGALTIFQRRDFMKKIRRMRKSLVIPAVLLSLALVWAGCGGGGGASAPPPTPITSAAEATYAASASSQSASLAVGTGATFLNMGMLGLFSLPAPQFKAPKNMELTGGTAITAKLSDKFAKSPAVAAATAQIKKAVGSRATVIISDGGVCYDGGTWSANGTFDDSAGTFRLTLTFTDCRQYDTAINGTYSMTGAVMTSSISLTMSLSGFSITEYDPTSNYGTIVSSMTADIDFTGNMGGNATSLIFTMTGNGTIDATEGPISYNLTFTNYSISDTYTPGTSFDTDNIATNGKVSESWTIGPDTFVASISYENFVVGIKTYTDATASNYWDEEISINGVFTLDFTPNQCFEGRFSIQTTTPIYWDDTLLRTTAGRLVINSNTTVIFNNDGTVTVQYQGADIPGLVNVSEADLAGVCLIAAL